MRKYEVIFVIKPLDEEAINATIEKMTTLIKKNGGTVDKEDRWGKRRLAYEVQKFVEGYYCLLYVSCEPACVAEVDRVMKITENVLKHMIVRSDEHVQQTKPTDESAQSEEAVEQTESAESVEA